MSLDLSMKVKNYLDEYFIPNLKTMNCDLKVFIPEQLNESNISNAMRLKSLDCYTTSLKYENAIVIEFEYICQEPFTSNELYSFLDELERAINYNLNILDEKVPSDLKKEIDLNTQIVFKAEIRSRDGYMIDDSGKYYEHTNKFNWTIDFEDEEEIIHVENLIKNLYNKDI